MKKLYYTCPLQAAYMAKHYKVKLYAVHSDEQMCEYDLTEEQRNFNWFDACSCEGTAEIEMISEAVEYIENISGKIYIDNASMPIFEPQAGDIITGNEGPAMVHLEKTYYSPGSKEANITQVLISSATYLCETGEIKIIQRDNKPFIMPQVENDK